MYQPINGVEFNLLDAFIVSLIAIILVFLVLTVIIFVASIFSTILIKVDNKKNINPRPENAILSEDEDAVVALLVATIDYKKEMKKDARLVKISRIDEE